MKKLNIEHVYLGIEDKLSVYESLKEMLSLKNDEIAYCGDDINDLCVIEKAGFTACPNNAVTVVKDKCHYISLYKGGTGFVRDICDILITAKERVKKCK